MDSDRFDLGDTGLVNMSFLGTILPRTFHYGWAHVQKNVGRGV